jgi:hypothetical protein
MFPLPEATVVADHGLHRSGCRDGDERAQDAKQRNADQDRHDDDQRVKLDGASVHVGLDQVVLDLLIEDLDRDPDDQPGRSKKPNRIASGTANGTSRIRSVTYVTSPAATLITKFPNTYPAIASDGFRDLLLIQTKPA